MPSHFTHYYGFLSSLKLFSLLVFPCSCIQGLFIFSLFLVLVHKAKALNNGETRFATKKSSRTSHLTGVEWVHRQVVLILALRSFVSSFGFICCTYSIKVEAYLNGCLALMQSEQKMFHLLSGLISREFNRT